MKLRSVILFVALVVGLRAQVLDTALTASWGSVSAFATGQISPISWDVPTSKWKIGVAASLVSGTAAGRNYSVSIGGATALGSIASTGAAVASLNPSTAYTVTHWMDAAGQGRWNGTSLTYTTPAPPKVVRSAIINVRNQWNVNVKFRWYQEGRELGNTNLEPGKAASFQIQTLSDMPITITETPIGWKLNPLTGEYEYNTEGGPDTENFYGSSDPKTFGVAPVQTPPLPNNPTPLRRQEGGVEVGANPGSSGSGPVWQTATTGALDIPTFKEGIGILSGKFDALNSQLRSGLVVSGSTGSGGSGGTTGAATNAKLDEVKASVDAVKTSVDLQKTDRIAEKSAAETAMDLLKGSIGSESVAKAAEGKAMVTVPSGSFTSTSHAGAPNNAFWTITLGAHSFNANPLANPILYDVSIFTRSLFVWVCAVGLVIGLVKNNDWLVQGSSSAQMTTAAPISVLGTGSGIPAALLKAALATTIIFASVPLSFAVFSGDLNGISIIGQLFSNPLNSAASAVGGAAAFVGEGIKLLNAFVPVDFSFMCLVTWVTHKFSCQTITLGIAAGFRWIAG